MVNKFQGTILGMFVFLFGLVMTYYTWNMIVGFYELIDSTLLKVIWTFGFLCMWILNIIVIPYLLIIGSGVKYGNAAKGVIIFLVASFCTLLSYYIIPPIIEALDDITEFGDLTIVGELIWFGLILFWVLSLIVYPIFIILKGGIKEKETDE